MNKLSYCQVAYELVGAPRTYFAENFTLLLVLQGEVVVEDEGKKQLLYTGEVYCLNLNHLVILSSVNFSESILALIQIDALFFTSQYSAFFNVTFSIPEDATQTTTAELTNTVIELCLNAFGENEDRKIYHLMKLETILLLLVQKFQDEQRHALIVSKDFRLRDILAYIDTYYARGLKVKEIAQHFFLSESSLSKIFKRETGEHLSRYLKKIQIHKSLTELLYTKKSIEQLALDFGFGSGKVYREQFKTFFAMTPAEYRQNHENREQKTTFALPLLPHELESKKIIRLLYGLIQNNRQENRPSHLEHRNRHLLVETENTCATTGKKAAVIIQIGSLAELSEVKIQEELRQLKQNKALHYISCLRLISEPSISYLLARKLKLNSFPAFEELDSALRFLIQEQIPLILTISKARYDQFGADLYEDFFQHIRHKFGKSLLQLFQLNVEFSEPILQEELDFYQFLRHQTQQFAPMIRTGIKLPLADPFHETDIKRILSQLQELMETTCDFLTFTADPNFIFQQAKSEMIDLSDYHQYVYNKTRFLRKELLERKFKLPLYLLEWNTLTGTTVDYNGLFFRGALVVQELLRLDKVIDGYGFWLNLNSHERELPAGMISSTALDIFHFQSKKRPTYFCLQLVKRLRGLTVSEGDFYILTRNHDRYQLLLWNTNYFDPHLSSEEAFIDSQALDVTVELAHLPKGRYQIKQLDLDRNHGALFYVYGQFQQVQQLDEETEAYVDAKTRMKLQVFNQSIQSGFTHFLTLDTNAVTLLEFTPI